MSLQNKIFLIGMPGSGKSTVGRQLSEQLNMPFVDLDHDIEEQAQCSIKEIFTQHGEAYFRNLEHEALMKAAQSSDHVIVATGGGAPCFFNNMDIIKSNGISIFIDTSLDELVSRLNTYEKEKRPKFSGGEELKEQLEKLHKSRLPFYQQADLKWISSEETVDELISKLKKLN